MSEPDVADDTAFDEWLEEDDEAPPRGGVVLRRPLLLLAVLLGTAFVAYKSWPRAAYLLQANTPAECGDITERPQQRLEAPASLPPLTHDRFCTLQGTVQVLPIFATSAKDEDPNAPEVGRKYFLKLAGDNVFAVLAADRRDVRDHRARKGSLFGFFVQGTGRMVDPDAEPGYQNTARVLRLRFSIPDNEPLRIFDTTDAPGDYWPSAVVLVLMALTALLAGYGLFRIALMRLRARASGTPAT